jgi:transposase InsO family protein
VSPMRRRAVVECVMSDLGLSERRACRVRGQPRAVQRYAPRPRDDEAPLTARVIELAGTYGRYGYRRITAMLHPEAWRVNHKRIERVWQHASLKVPTKQPRRGRLWLNEHSCIRLRPERRDHMWAYDFVTARTHDGRGFKDADSVG